MRAANCIDGVSTWSVRVGVGVAGGGANRTEIDEKWRGSATDCGGVRP